MEVTRREDAAQLPPIQEPMAAHFTGDCGMRALHVSERPHPLTVALVSFPIGARNHWHRHAGGQVLHVVDGEGYVQQRGESPTRIRAGDSVSTSPDEEHWHGATEDSPMTHIAVTVGETTWLDDPDA